MANFFPNNLSFLRDKSGLSQLEMASELGLGRSTYANYESGATQPKFEVIEDIVLKFGINGGDLLFSDLSKGNLISKLQESKNTQKGNLKGNPIGNLIDKRSTELLVSEPEIAYGSKTMPKVVTIDSQGNDNIVHVPIKARAGYLLGYGDPTFIETLPTYKLPGLRHGTFRSFEIEGPSMKPNLLNRDWAVGEWVESLNDIRENRVHIVVTRNDGILIKRVLNRIKERNKLYLKSDTITQRAEYPIIEIDPTQVAEIWYARIKFSPDFSEPGEIYTRLNDLEINLMELKKQIGTSK